VIVLPGALLDGPAWVLTDRKRTPIALVQLEALDGEGRPEGVHLEVAAVNFTGEQHRARARRASLQPIAEEGVLGQPRLKARHYGHGRATVARLNVACPADVLHRLDLHGAVLEVVGISSMVVTLV